MPLEVKKKQGETSKSLVYRFSKKVKQSGILIEARRKRFFERRRSKKLEKRAALRRKQIEEERQRLEKLGEIRY